MIEYITGDLCHVYDPEAAQRFVHTFQHLEQDDAVALALGKIEGHPAHVLVEMSSVTFVFDTDGARDMAAAFAHTVEMYPDFGRADDCRTMAAHLRGAADKAEEFDEEHGDGPLPGDVRRPH